MPVLSASGQDSEHYADRSVWLRSLSANLRHSRRWVWSRTAVRCPSLSSPVAMDGASVEAVQPATDIRVARTAGRNCHTACHHWILAASIHIVSDPGRSCCGNCGRSNPHLPPLNLLGQRGCFHVLWLRQLNLSCQTQLRKQLDGHPGDVNFPPLQTVAS